MNDAELILRLIEVKASHYWGSSFTYGQTHFEECYKGTPSALAREEIYDAKCDALREIVQEIRRGMSCTRSDACALTARSPDTRYVFITEMAGTMTATIMSTSAELDDAQDRFARDHADYFEENGNATSAYNTVVITPRGDIPTHEALSTGVLDVRFVLITDVDRDFNAIICDTEAELKREVEAFKREYAEWIKTQDAVWSSHEIVIPPPERSGGAAAPFHQHAPTRADPTAPTGKTLWTHLPGETNLPFDAEIQADGDPILKPAGTSEVRHSCGPAICAASQTCLPTTHS